MFSRFLLWIRTVLNLINKNDIQRAIKKDVAVSDKMANAINLWSRLYEGHPPWIKKDQTSLNLPASIASEFARMVTIEMKSEITGSKRADYLNDQYKLVLNGIKQYVEFGCGKGGVVFKPYPVNDLIRFDVAHADCFFPTSFDSVGNVTGAIFIEQKTIGKITYTRIESHTLENGTYTITNKAFQSTIDTNLGSELPLTSVNGWEDIAPETIFKGIERPLFAYFKYPLANNVDSRSPLGVACFARATKIIENADEQWNRILWEFEGSELAVDASIDALKPNPNRPGKTSLPKHGDRLFRQLDTVDQNFYEVFTPEIRDSSLFNGLNKMLQRVEFNCNLAYGTISDPTEIEKTAEEIRASKQRSYSMVVDIQKSLQKALENLIYAMDVWTTLYKLAPEGKYEVSFEFDDSIIADRNKEFTERQMLITMQASYPWELRMWYFGETEDQAKEALGVTDTTNDDLITSISGKTMTEQNQ